MFPGEDVLDNVHGAAQSVWDIRRLVSWIRTQDPGARIGVNGVSLGGYITSLVASLEDGLACAIVGVRVVDLVDLIEAHAVWRPTTSAAGSSPWPSGSIGWCHRWPSRRAPPRAASSMRDWPIGLFTCANRSFGSGSTGAGRHRLVRRQSHRLHAFEAVGHFVREALTRSGMVTAPHSRDPASTR